MSPCLPWGSAFPGKDSGTLGLRWVWASLGAWGPGDRVRLRGSHRGRVGEVESPCCSSQDLASLHLLCGCCWGTGSSESGSLSACTVFSLNVWFEVPKT